MKIELNKKYIQKECTDPEVCKVVDIFIDEKENKTVVEYDVPTRISTRPSENKYVPTFYTEFEEQFETNWEEYC